MKSGVSTQKDEATELCVSSQENPNNKRLSTEVNQPKQRLSIINQKEDFIQSDSDVIN